MKFLCHFRLWVILILVFIVACASTEDPQRKRKAEAARNLGEAYLREGNFTLALKELLKAESLNPDDHYLQNDIGLTYYGKRKYDKAVQHYKKALDLKRDYAPAMNNLGNAYMAQKRWDSAIEAGYRIPPHYDSMVGKLIVHGPDRQAALEGAEEALESLRIEGVCTTVPLHLRILRDPGFRSGDYDLNLLGRSGLVRVP